MNNIDTLLQYMDAPEPELEPLTQARQERILRRTLQLTAQTRRHTARRRTARILIAAAAAVAVLCGAAEVWHYASVSNEETAYHVPVKRTLADGTTQSYFEDYTSDSIIRIDTEGRTAGTYCGVQFGWTPAALIPDHTAYLYDVIAYRNPEQLNGAADDQIALAKDCVYSTDCLAQVTYTFSCLSANEFAGIDLFVIGNDPTIVKEGMLNELYACWIETYDADRGTEVTNRFLLLYDPEKLCVVILSGDWDITEKMADNMTIVQTEIPTPEPKQSLGYIGAFG